MTRWDIRPATVEDVPVLAAIHAASWRSAGFAPLDEVELEMVIAERCNEADWYDKIKNGRTLIGYLNGTPGAFVQFGINADGQGEILRMYALFRHWGSGLAGALMSEALHELQAMGAEECVVMSSDTPRSKRFYEKCGFKPTGDTLTAPLWDDVICTDYEYVLAL